MTFLTSLFQTLAFRGSALRTLAERRAVGAGVAFFAIGFLFYALVRGAVYASLPELTSRQGSWIGYATGFQLVQALLFLLLIYIPAVAAMSNAISGDGIGFSVSRQEYRAQVSGLLPLWGALSLIAAPVQWLAPHFLISGAVEISIGMLVRLALVAAYTLWGIKQLNYLTWIQSLGVFALSFVTFPVYFVLIRFLSALPFFFLIVLAYFGYQWARGFFAGHAGDRDFRRHLHGLTVNPQDADAHYQLGLIHFKRRNLDAARRYFESALKIDPEDADYHYYLGRTHEQEGAWAPALEHYSEVYRIDPEYGLGDIFREVGKGYLHTGNVEKAMEFLNYFLSRRGSDPEGRYWLAVALQKSGDPAQMRAQLSRILEQARTNPRFFRKEHREWIYRARNMMRESRFAFRD